MILLSLAKKKREKAEVVKEEATGSPEEATEAEVREVAEEEAVEVVVATNNRTSLRSPTSPISSPCP